MFCSGWNGSFYNFQATSKPTSLSAVQKFCEATFDFGKNIQFLKRRYVVIPGFVNAVKSLIDYSKFPKTTTFD